MGVFVALASVLVYKASSCSNIDIERAVAEAVPGGTVCFDHIYRDGDWDSLYVLTPYAVVDSMGLDMSRADRDALDRMSYSDAHCTVIFVRGRRVVAWGPVALSVADFGRMGRGGFPRTQCFAVDGRKVATQKR